MPTSIALVLSGLLAGCSMPRGSSDEVNVEVDSVAVASGPVAPSGPRSGLPSGPNISAVPYGLWTFTAEEVDGGDTLSRTLVLAEAGAGSRFAAGGRVASARVNSPSSRST